MDADAGRVFLDYSARKLEQLNGRIVTCLAKLSYQQVWSRGGENENAPANLVLHLCGNVQQWIGTGLAGRPDVRKRGEEFAAREGVQPDALSALLYESVRDAVAVLLAFPASRLMEYVTIQAYRVTALEAINHVVEHFAQHAGQLIYATKLATGEDLGFYTHLNQPGEHRQRVP